MVTVFLYLVVVCSGQLWNRKETNKKKAAVYRHPVGGGWFITIVNNALLAASADVWQPVFRNVWMKRKWRRENRLGKTYPFYCPCHTFYVPYQLNGTFNRYGGAYSVVAAFGGEAGVVWSQATAESALCITTRIFCRYNGYQLSRVVTDSPLSRCWTMVGLCEPFASQVTGRWWTGRHWLCV